MIDPLEIHFSKAVHSNSIPLLISAHFLRSRNCGQVDLASFKKEKSGIRIELFEVKRGGNLSEKQRIRLRRSGALLSMIFDCSVRSQVLTSMTSKCRNSLPK